ncbi:hypothetical protein GPALN_002963 [Globodera pallida]|nr:hypothetical protein GPALN_002963 [Globodera pallida]
MYYQFDEGIDFNNIWSQPKSPCGITLPSTISGEADSDLTSKIESQLAQYKNGCQNWLNWLGCCTVYLPLPYVLSACFRKQD